MNILFLTLSRTTDINNRGIYTDLMRKFRDEGHSVYIVSPLERRFQQNTNISKIEGITLLKIKTLNIQKTNLIEKGISTLLIEHQFLAGIKKYFSGIRFDLVLYSTPPITFTKVINYIRQHDGAKSYLLLKDIFPQNAVDLGMIKKSGIIHRYFRRKEKQLYRVSDFIGCMSPANVTYLLKHNPEIPSEKVEVNPNSIELTNHSISEAEKAQIRKKYNVPEDAIVFVYGGNLGKPQGLDFLPNVIQTNKEKQDAFFLVVGSGTEFNRLNRWFKQQVPPNALLLPGLPKHDYDLLVQACDVGLIFLDKRFTIPNFPSRLLSYLEYRMPVIAATDPNTDIGKIAEENGFGFSVINGDLGKMIRTIEWLLQNKNKRIEMGETGFEYLKKNYLVDNSFKILNKHFRNR
jgi:glycosyltransferase involved in cell wall biosynthesis